ncbi:MAG: ferredoxin [Candidatus Bathyarchaeia archaeon]
MANFIIEVDRKACQGFGACVELCPKFFQLSDDGKTSLQEAKKSQVTEENMVIKETLDMDNLDCVKAAAEACPFNAIHITNTKTGEKLI